jgi:hypothetical protein
MQADLTSSTAIADSLQRLSKHLHALLHSMAGEDPPESHRDGSTRRPEEEAELLKQLLDNREDWAFERETEIERLEKENEELRKLLGIDFANIEAKGWLEDEQRELALSRYMPVIPPHSHDPMQGASHPADDRLGNGMSPFVNINVVPPGTSRPMDPMPGMRVTQGRRPSMFGQRGRGGGPGLWEGAAHPPPIQERPWQAQVGLDLS